MFCFLTNYMKITSTCPLESPIHQFCHTLISTFMGGVYGQVVYQSSTVFSGDYIRYVVVSQSHSANTVSATAMAEYWITGLLHMNGRRGVTDEILQH